VARPREPEVARPEEIAADVYLLPVGKGLMRSNVYLVRSGPAWVLIDAGAANCGSSIQKAADSLFGQGARAVSIFLTHSHPDHAGSARELARRWECTVYVHPDELPLASGDISAFRRCANPLDRWAILPLLRLLGSRRTESIVSEASFKDVALSLDPSASLPGLPDWKMVPTPGHTPGHVAFFRATDRVLIAGDALLTVNLNSLWSLIRNKPTVSGPPWYTTWNWPVAKNSVASLARLEPRVLAGGHGIPATGAETAGSIRAFSDRF
jgi:glyoxylase-like metal-dependent hydrolase (beta-lactamase superfamily II)